MWKFVENLIDGLCSSNNNRYLDDDFCDGKSNDELIETLKKGEVLFHDASMIVTELLDRLVKDKKV